MVQRTSDKIEEIENYLEELSEIAPPTLESYEIDFVKKAACERYFERIVEAIVDLAFLVIKEMELRVPEGDKETFDILFEKGMISGELAERLKDAKGMRNVIAHEYGKVDDELVFNAVSEELPKDADEFINAIRKNN